jgi:hypothetical protein
VGKLLLRTEPVDFNGVSLRITEETFEGTKGKGRVAVAPPPTTAGGMFIPRAAGSRPKAGLGHSRKPLAPGATFTATSAPPFVAATSTSTSTAANAMDVDVPAVAEEPAAVAAPAKGQGKKQAKAPTRRSTRSSARLSKSAKADEEGQNGHSEPAPSGKGQDDFRKMLSEN